MRKVLFLSLLLLCSVSLFAQSGDTIPELNEWGENILGLAMGQWVAAIMTVALMIIFGVIAFGNAQGEGGMFKKMWPWLVGVIGIGSAGGIVQYFWPKG
jgi:hypothetical protein